MATAAPGLTPEMVAAIDKLGVQAKASVASVNGPKSVVIAGAEAEVLEVRVHARKVILFG